MIFIETVSIKIRRSKKYKIDLKEFLLCRKQQR